MSYTVKIIAQVSKCNLGSWRVRDNDLGFRTVDLGSQSRFGE